MMPEQLRQPLPVLRGLRKPQTSAALTRMTGGKHVSFLFSSGCQFLYREHIPGQLVAAAKPRQ